MSGRGGDRNGLHVYWVVRGALVVVVIAAVLGGAMFGDNLSIISDTTIAATKSCGCEMNDKFKMNFLEMKKRRMRIELI